MYHSDVWSPSNRIFELLGCFIIEFAKTLSDFRGEIECFILKIIMYKNLCIKISCISIHVILVQENSVKDLHPSDFDENDKMYDAGEYQYRIDDNFEPKQSPGRAYHPILTKNVPSFLV